MHYEISHIEVDDLKLFGPTGDFGRWMQRIEYEAISEAVREAPHGAGSGRVNKTGPYPVGSLQASIECDYDRIAARIYELTLSANVPYAVYVHEGTGTIIKQVPGQGFAAAKAGQGMYLPANPGWGPARWRQRVRGQNANPFLTRAMENVGLAHAAINIVAG